MLNEKTISRNLPPLTLPPAFGDVLSVHIYLYRGPEPRCLHPCDCFAPDAEQETRLFQRSCFQGPSNLAFAVNIEPATLKLPQPLWFNIVIGVLNFISPVFTTFMQIGGGGRGSAHDDSVTIAHLFDLLRTFPKDWPYWQRKGFEKPAEPPEVRIFS